jgi:flagellar basal-body rod protein FlgG
MDPLTISAASGMRSRLESLDMLANNLANATAPGYKNDIESYGLYMSDDVLAEGMDVDPVTARLPVIERQWTDFSQGLLHETGNPLDVAISGEGFFTVQGREGIVYTRNGRFHLGGDVSVLTQDGFRVMRTDGVPLQATGSGAIQIGADGTVTQGGEALGRLAIARFADPHELRKAGAGNYKARSTPQPATGAELLQGRTEGSNVNTPESSIRLISVMRHFEMLTKAVQLNSEMNRKATSEVAKVNP